MAHDVFISYSSIDKPIGDATCAALEARGIRCWIAPRDITPGEEWGSAIVHAIQSSRAFVLLFSSNSDKSHQVVREVERAVNRGIPIIPLRLENVMPTESLEYFINTPHWLDAFQPPMDKHLAYLGDVIQHILDGTPPPERKAAPPPQNPLPSKPVLIGGGALAAVLLVALIWFAAGFNRTTPPATPASAPVVAATAQPAPAQPATAQPTTAQMLAALAKAAPSTTTAPAGTYSSVQGNGSMASLLSQLGVSDLQHTQMRMSDADGIYQVLGCEGLVDTRNLIYADAGQKLPAPKQLQADGKGYDVDTSALPEAARANVATIQDYGKRASCS